MMAIIRQENQSDHRAVFALIEKAFKNEAFSDSKEQFLVERLRNSDAFIPELSLVAEIDNRVVGHILLTKIKIISEKHAFDSLALAPVTVLPDFQKLGIGGQLSRYAHKIAIELGYSSIILLGHKDYYPKFGYSRADKFGIELPFDVPAEHCMAIELIENGLKGVNGTVEYPKAFGE
jgi:predicted N-acetyltransferase YhbS